jgi:hypothetical protein
MVDVSRKVTEVLVKEFGETGILVAADGRRYLIVEGSAKAGELAFLQVVTDPDWPETSKGGRVCRILSDSAADALIRLEVNQSDPDI